MARISLNKVVTDTLVKRFQGLASGGGSNEQSLAKALRGDSSEASIRSGLRTGAQTFAKAIQGLNLGITFFNTAKATLEDLDKITDKLIELAQRSSKSTTSSQERYEADLEFKKLGRSFKKIVDEAKIGENEFLNLEGISGFLLNFGLDQKSSQSIEETFKKFKVVAGDDSLASLNAQGPRPARIPPQAYSATAGFSVEYEKIFEEQVSIRTRPNAYKVLSDLEALKKQITDNSKALDNGIEIIGKNIDLVRAAGFAFLDLSEQISDSDTADEVAQQLRRRIRIDAPGALSQAENLESIVVAALALDFDKLGISSR